MRTEAGVTLITAQGQAIQALEIRLTGDIKAQGERIDRVFDVLRHQGERLARIEVKLDIESPAEGRLAVPTAPQAH